MIRSRISPGVRSRWTTGPLVVFVKGTASVPPPLPRSFPSRVDHLLASKPFGERMARRTFHVIDITEILAHWYAGRSQYDVAGSLGVDRKTIRRYVEPAIAAGFVPGGTPPMNQDDWAPLVKQWFPHLTDTRLRQVTWPEFAKHHDYVVEMLRAGVTKATIHQRLRDEHGVAGSLASFKRYVTANLAEDAVRDKVTVLRADPEPGLEGQIDYGLLGSWMDPRTGRSQRIWAFVMVLSHSRHMFVRPVISMDQASWTASHVEAFAFFGGCPARLIPDNLKTGVDKPDLYDPQRTGLMPSSPRTTASWSTRHTPASPKTSPASSGRCLTSGTPGGKAGSSPRWSRCRPRRCTGAGRSPGSASIAAWTGAPRRRCSIRPRRAR
nr:hypothetical protein [Actinoplanes solisilvae]